VQELVDRYGLETEERLREMVMVRLRQRALVEQHSAMQQQAARHLLDHTSMLLPERLTSRQAERNLHRARVDLMYRGLDENQIEERVAQLRRNSSAAAVRDLKLMFILNKAATQLNVQVTQDDVMGRVTQIAAERGVPADKLARELHSKNQLGHIAQQIREHKALDAIIAGAKVTELPVDEFNARMKAAAGA
jgi:FKBP-type peptidyl-prolyl cis-trans isomerase (trigger factor)